MTRRSSAFLISKPTPGESALWLRGLPLAREVSDAISLTSHLALAVCRRGKGNEHLLNELVCAVYLVYFLQQSGYGNEPLELFREAEVRLGRTAWQGKRRGLWHLDQQGAALLERVLAVYDSQLTRVALGAVLQARDRLRKVLSTKGSIPLFREISCARLVPEC
jgi:hypothetical protein